MELEEYKTYVDTKETLMKELTSAHNQNLARAGVGIANFKIKYNSHRIEEVPECFAKMRLSDAIAKLKGLDDEL